MRRFPATMLTLAAIAVAGAAHAQVLLVNNGMEDTCRDAARDRGWKVRDTDKPKMFGERRMDMHMRVRDGHHSFDAICTAEDDKVTLHRRD